MEPAINATTLPLAQVLDDGTEQLLGWKPWYPHITRQKFCIVKIEYSFILCRALAVSQL